ncbi:MAG: hypothetical protein ACM30I_16145 [Gemmatimonas sp.]
MRLYRLAATMLVTVTVAGCTRADGIATVSSINNDIYDSADMSREIAAKDTLVVVRGSAFGLDQRALEQAIVSDMQGAAWGPQPRLTTTPGSNVGQMWSFVMMVNGPRNVTAAALCRDPAQAPALTEALPAGEFRLVGGLCRFDKNMTEVTGRLEGVTGADDPRVRRLIMAATQELTTPTTADRFLHQNDSSGSNER